MKPNKQLQFAIISTLFVVGSAKADTISYYLDQSNALPDGINYAQVTISDGTGGDIDFLVDVITSAFTPDTNFGMQSFSFNYDNPTAVSSSNIMNIDPSSWTISQETNAGGGFGKFDFELAGTGTARTETLSFSIANVTGDTVYDYAVASGLMPSSGDFFAAHIAGFAETNGVTSAQFAGSTPVVPIPAAVWLFGSGLIGLVGIARKRKG